ncbi:MAG TPA: shikimate dehydrogenase [Anaerolineales bacterium]
MIRLGLVGYPLEHSLSPLLHTAALKACGLEGDYSLHTVRPGDATGLGALANKVRAGELTGLNVTIPHKRAIIPFLDELSPAARTMGAVNVLCRRGGRVVGDNTDAPAFITALHTILPRPRSAVILGAGGAARAVAYALWATGCEVTVAARRMEQARELAKQFPSVQAMQLGHQALEAIDPDLIVNATPLGMFPDVESRAWPADLPFPRKAVVCDLVYNPLETELLQAARGAGLRVLGGLGMLIEQAALAFQLWTGCNVRRELLTESLRLAIS